MHNHWTRKVLSYEFIMTENSAGILLSNVFQQRKTVVIYTALTIPMDAAPSIFSLNAPWWHHGSCISLWPSSNGRTQSRNSLPIHCLPSCNWLQKAIENGPVEIVDLPMNSMVDLSSSLCKRLPKGNYPFKIGIFQEINHPALSGTPMAIETSM